MFERLRKKRDERRRDKAHADFERAASESDPALERGDQMTRRGIDPPGL
jgi:hypothetical protein